MKNIFRVSIIILLAIFSANTFAKNPCNSTVESERADAMLDDLDNWDSIYQYYDKYSKYNCYSTGYFGESIADSVVKILSVKWNTLNELAIKINSNKKFGNFILSKINSTVDSNDLIKIHELANKNCPTNLLKLCKMIDKETIRAFEEMGGKL